MGKLVFKKQDDKRKLLKKFSDTCSQPTIDRALRYATNSKAAFQIRQYALACCNAIYIET